MKSKFPFMSPIVLLVAAFLSGCATTPPNTPLLTAVSTGNKAEIKELLNKGVNINELSGPENITPLMAASRQGDLDTVKELLKAGANINTQNEYGNTALTWAGEKCRPEIIQLLIDNGADVNAQTKDYQFRVSENLSPKSTPLMFAADCDDVATVKALLAKGANPNAKRFGRWSAMYDASRADHWEIVRTLLEAGADVRTLDDPNAPPPPPKSWREVQIWGSPPEKEQNFNGNDALYFAAAKGVDPIVKLLIEKGVDLNFAKHWPGSSHLVPLVISANNNHPSTVTILLDAGADINYPMHLIGRDRYQFGEYPNPNGNYPALIVAIKRGHKEIVNLLVKRGANVNVTDSDGKTALAYAVDEKHAEIEVVLRQAGATK